MLTRSKTLENTQTSDVAGFRFTTLTKARQLQQQLSQQKRSSNTRPTSRFSLLNSSAVKKMSAPNSEFSSSSSTTKEQPSISDVSSTTLNSQSWKNPATFIASLSTSKGASNKKQQRGKLENLHSRDGSEGGDGEKEVEQEVGQSKLKKRKKIADDIEEGKEDVAGKSKLKKRQRIEDEIKEVDDNTEEEANARVQKRQKVERAKKQEDTEDELIDEVSEKEQQLPIKLASRTSANSWMIANSDDEEIETTASSSSAVAPSKQKKQTKTKKQQKIQKAVECTKMKKSDPEYKRIGEEFHKSACPAIRILSIERIQNDRLQRRFEKANEEFAKKGHHGAKAIYQGWHSTALCNVQSIVNKGLLLSKVGESAGSAYGAGLYHGATAACALQFATLDDECIGAVILFDLQPGRSMPLRLGCCCYDEEKCHPEFDSHRVEKADFSVDQWVLFQEEQCLPKYVITFSHGHYESDDD